MHRTLLERATRCPECGKPVCSFGKRAFSLPVDRKRNCQHCGCGCKTPVWVYLVMIAAAGLAGFGAYDFDAHRLPLLYWGLSREFFVFFFWTYFLSGAVMMVLVPFRSCPEMRRTVPTRGYAPRIRMKKTFRYAADHVYAAACSSLRRADNYKILEKRPEERYLRLSRGGGAPRWRLGYRGTDQTFACWVDLWVIPREDGTSEICAAMEKKWGAQDWEEHSEVLTELCEWIVHDLEIYQYPRAHTYGKDRRR